MAQHKHLFVMDSLENLNLKLDSSLRLAAALTEKGHQCYMCSPGDMGQKVTKNDSKVYGTIRQLNPDDHWQQNVGQGELRELTDFSTVHMRKDPPIDMNYISCTWLLSELQKTAKVYNCGQTLRDKNEKLAIFDYSEYIQPGIVSSDPGLLWQFLINEGEGDVIVKPLDLFGGRGVFRIETAKASKQAILESLQEATKNGQEMRLLQPFNKDVFEGEVRVFTAFGEIISWCLKVPSKGEFLANTRAGASVLEYDPPPAEVEMVKKVSQSLRSSGVEFVGYDLIGGYISEINITSPRLLLAPGVDEKPYYRKIAELIEADLGIK